MNSVEKEHVIEFIDGLSAARRQPTILPGSLREQVYKRMLETVVQGLLDEEVFPERPAGSLRKLAYDKLVYQLNDEQMVNNFVHHLSFAPEMIERTARSLRELAWAKLVGEMRKIGCKYEFMRFVDPSKPRVLVVVDLEVLVLTRRPTSQMFVDFPHYNDENRQMPVDVNVDTYYTIDRVEKGASSIFDFQHYVAACITPLNRHPFPGNYEGKNVQMIVLIDREGAATAGPRMVHFVVAFDD